LKVLASCTSDKGQITGIYRELKKLNSPKINEPIKIWATEINRTFSKEEIQMTKKHMKKCLLPYYAYVFSSTKLVIMAEQILPGSGVGGGGDRGQEGEMTQLMYAHVNK
jgi:hypothetical protein